MLALISASVGTLLLLIGGVIPAAVAYSILAGASIGALYTLQGIYTHELVGAQNLSMLMGAQNAVFAVGGAAGPLLAGVLFEAAHSYTLVVLLTAAAFLVSAVILATSKLSRNNHSRADVGAQQTAAGVGNTGLRQRDQPRPQRIADAAQPPKRPPRISARALAPAGMRCHPRIIDR